MNVISNNCCGGWLYTHNKMEYNNPFMWSITQYDSIMYLLQHFYEINWANIKLSESPLRNKTYQICVDKHVAIHYIHCLFNKDKSKPTKIFRPTIGNDIDYSLIWEYVYDKYITRVKRMIHTAEEPIFLLSPDASSCTWSNDQIKALLGTKTCFKCILITTNLDISTKNDNFMIIHVPEYPSHSQVILSNLHAINRFIGIA